AEKQRHTAQRQQQQSSVRLVVAAHVAGLFPGAKGAIAIPPRAALGFAHGETSPSGPRLVFVGKCLLPPPTRHYTARTQCRRPETRLSAGGAILLGLVGGRVWAGSTPSHRSAISSPARARTCCRSAPTPPSLTRQC